MMKKKLFDMFAELFGNSEGARFYFSPGRVNLIGEHTDYNGGHVFPCALTLGTYGAARKREDNKIHFYSMNLDSFGVVEASLDDLTNKKEYNWANYPLGVVWAFKEKGHTITSGFDMVIWKQSSSDHINAEIIRKRNPRLCQTASNTMETTNDAGTAQQNSVHKLACAKILKNM